MYNVEDLIEILFDKLYMGQEFSVAGKSPCSDHQLANMGVAKMLETQEYTHTYRMWKSITADDNIWLRFKAHFQEACLEIEDLEQMSGAEGYGSANNVKHGEM